MKKILIGFLVVVFVLSMALTGIGCKAETTVETTAAETTGAATTVAETTAAATTTETGKKLVISYVCKMSTHPWFIMQIDAMQKRCDELGITLKVIDANNSSEAFLKGVDVSIAEGIDGLLATPPDESVGPATVEAAEKAGIPIATVADTMKDSAGNVLPIFGVDRKEYGMVGGHGIAKLARERGFFEAGNIVKVMLVDMSMVSVIHDCTLGFKEALMQDIPELKEEDYIMEDTKDSSMEAALPVVSSILAANPTVTHWLITAISDDQALGALRVLEENQFPIKNALSCGTGGFKMSLEEFQNGNDSLATVKTSAKMMGDAAIDGIYNTLTKNEPLVGTNVPAEGFVYLANYKDFDWAGTF